MAFRLNDWRIEEITGYHPISTFYTDFSIADAFGVDAIKDTYKRAFDNWKGDYKMLTELCMVLNWKIFEHYTHDDTYAKLYDSLWKKADEYACDNLKDDELDYYFRTTD